MFVDSDHTRDKVSCRSRNGFPIHLNITLVQWFSKKQSTVGIPIIGTEFVTTKQGIDALRDLRYKLRMMGIPILGPSYIYNTSKPVSVLRKKSNSVCYYAICELVAMGEFLVGHIPNKDNVAHLMTQVLYGQILKYLLSNILHDVNDDYWLPVKS